MKTRPRPNQACILATILQGRTVINLPILFSSRLARFEKRHCAGAVVKWILLVMLEKMFGVRLVSKLRAILLMEADFNTMNKEVYGVWMLEEARNYKLIPEEIFSE
jgi:hypothetical protein